MKGAGEFYVIEEALELLLIVLPFTSSLKPCLLSTPYDWIRFCQ